MPLLEHKAIERQKHPEYFMLSLTLLADMVSQDRKFLSIFNPSLIIIRLICYKSLLTWYTVLRVKTRTF